MVKKLLTIFCFWGAVGLTMAQEKCWSHIYEQELRQRYPGNFGTVESFENWLKEKMGNGYLSQPVKMPNGRLGGGPYKIKVIFHVIYQTSQATIANGSENIPYAQAMSQIRVLNEDFQRTNADASQTRSIFQTVAGSFPDLEFEPATHDPFGNPLPEPGVERINGQTTFGITAWTTTQCDNTLKPATIWNPNQYLNIWVVNFSSSGLFGYAQFPEGSGLPGMPTSTQPSNTDGIVLNYKSTGSNYLANGLPDPAGPFITAPIAPGTDRGRTATHEIGHWLGLRHSWGDGNCSADDFCSDTPWQNGDSPLTTNCASSHARNTCSAEDEPWGQNMPDQIENFMDYSADVCMNMFTRQQVDRMRIVLLNSPRRKELIGNTLFSIFSANVVGGNKPLQVTFTNRSGVTGTEPPITSWNWNFDVDGLGGASPATYTATSASTANPPLVTFNNVGTYRVRLTVSNGSKTDVSEMLIYVRLAPLQAPTNLIVTNQEGTSPNFFATDKIDLQWTDNSPDEDNFIVSRRKDGQPVSSAVDIATLPPNTTTYTDNSPSLEDGVDYIYQVRAKRGSETAASNTRKIKFKKSAVTGIEESPLAREILIYPNPAQNSFVVDLKGIQVQNARLVLYNPIGQVVGEQNTQNSEVSFNVERLPKGMYLLKIHTDKGVAVKRLSVQ
ncbi:MAG: T9SS type A sorting domain-containing protein [Raineya sp.]|nr:T9SS type A sorting domain-containing protein [Raineya sp.]